MIEDRMSSSPHQGNPVDDRPPHITSLLPTTPLRTSPTSTKKRPSPLSQHFNSSISNTPSSSMSPPSPGAPSSPIAIMNTTRPIQSETSRQLFGILGIPVPGSNTWEQLDSSPSAWNNAGSSGMIGGPCGAKGSITRDSPSSGSAGGETGKRTGRGKPSTMTMRTSGSPLRIVSNSTRSGHLGLCRTDDDDELEETQVVVMTGLGQDEDGTIPTSIDSGGIGDALQQQQHQHQARRVQELSLPSSRPGPQSVSRVTEQDVFGPTMTSSRMGDRMRSFTEPGRMTGTLEEYTRLLASDAENEIDFDRKKGLSLRDTDATPIDDRYTGPANGLKGRPRYRMLSRPLAPTLVTTEPDGFDIVEEDHVHPADRTRIDLEPILSSDLAVGGGFDSMETVVPFEHRVGGGERTTNRTRHQGESTSSNMSWRNLAPPATHLLSSNSIPFALGPTLSSLGQPETLGAGSTSSRILDPVDWENFSPQYLEAQVGQTGSIRGGSMMLVPPPNDEERTGVIRMTTGDVRLDHQALRERIGSHVYWNMFEQTQEYTDVAPLSASTNSNSARDSNTSASVGNTSISFDDDTGISTTRLVGSFDRFGTLQDEDELNSSEPEDLEDSARMPRHGIAPMQFGAARRPGSTEAYGFRQHSASASIEDQASIEEEDQSAMVYESSEGGRASEVGPIRTTRSSLRTRNAKATKLVPEAPASRNVASRKTTKRKASSASHPPQANVNAKPVRSLGDRGQGRKPSTLTQPDSPEDFDTTGMHPDTIAAKKARRREINRKSARTLREKRKAELESAWRVIDDLRSEMDEMAVEVRRERQWRMTMQEALIRRGVSLASLGINLDESPEPTTQPSVVSEMMHVDDDEGIESD